MDELQRTIHSTPAETSLFMFSETVTKAVINDFSQA